MKIILIGPPGSGKGTQAYFMMHRYNIPCVSVSNMLHDVINNDSNLGREVKDSINSGRLVSNELVINLVKKRIENDDCNNGFILDGFPRTVTQAYFIKNMHIVVDFVLVFTISEKSIIQRISGRYSHTPSGRIYHPKFNPPKIQGYDDITGEQLVFREDDDRQILQKRLLEYYCHTIPVIDFYHIESINNNIQYFLIDCDVSIFEIQCKLKKILG